MIKKESLGLNPVSHTLIFLVFSFLVLKLF